MTRHTRMLVLLMVAVATSGMTFSASAQLDTRTPGAFMLPGFGARAMGMGGAFVAIADDATAIYWNPAGLAQLNKAEIALSASTAVALEMYGIESKGLDLNLLSVVIPQRRGDNRSAWAFSFGRDSRLDASYRDIPVDYVNTNGDIVDTGTLDIRARDEFTSATLSYASGNARNLLGASLIRQTSELSGDWTQHYDSDPSSPVSGSSWRSDTGWGWQVGWLGRLETTAMGVTTLGATYRSEGGQDASIVDEWPASYAVGAAFQPTDTFRWALMYRHVELIAANILMGEVTSHHIGGEWMLSRGQRTIPLRAGFYRISPETEGLDSVNVFTLGSGIMFDRYGLDAAVEIGRGSFRRVNLSLVMGL